ncbi:MAG: LLM class flavin-dependent oxidoreductase [Actinobacteria bacterium]|nr:MAG: LLM class flavin-dependent oxidoreductase [Actinomycetota bacterium]
MDISCAFATALDTADYIAVAEQLGYRRAWCYDSPGLYADVWMVLAQAAPRTSTIGLGPAVLVPSLRHPMTNAAAIATLAAWAPERVAVAIGAGFTGRMVFGQRPMRWRDVEAYVRTLRALLRGEEAEWDGTRLKMLHTAHCVPPRPIDVPILIGADGPKGLAVAANVADGVFSAVVPQADPGPLTWRALLRFGTVLGDGEAPTSPRAIAAVGPALAVGYHALYERGGSAVDRLPGGPRWRESVESARPSARHLEIHQGHLIEANRHDQLVIEDAAPLAPKLTMTGSAAEVRERLGALAAVGVTEIAYQPAGPDIPRELEAFAAAADGV